MPEKRDNSGRGTAWTKKTRFYGVREIQLAIERNANASFCFFLFNIHLLTVSIPFI